MVKFELRSNFSCNFIVFPTLLKGLPSLSDVRMSPVDLSQPCFAGVLDLVAAVSNGNGTFKGQCNKLNNDLLDRNISA